MAVNSPRVNGGLVLCSRNGIRAVHIGTRYLIAPDRDGALWLASWGSGLIKFRPRTGGNNQQAFRVPTERVLAAHPWRGNVRELENRVRRAFIMTEGRQISADDLELAAAAEKAPAPGMCGCSLLMKLSMFTMRSPNISLRATL